MMQLITYFQSQNYTITFASPCANSDNAVDLMSLNIEQVPIQLNSSSFDAFIKNLNPNVVLFDRFMMEEQFGWRVAESCPNAIRILDTEDLHCLRKGRQQAFKDQKPFEASYLFSEIAKREIASIYRSDLSLIISEAELKILYQEFKVNQNLLFYLPFLLDEMTEENSQALPNFEHRQHFISIGNFLHEPNYDSVLYLKETIWPLIRKQLSKAELHIYGAYVPQRAMQLHNEKDGFLIKGFVEDVHDVMQNVKLCLAPLRFGAGLKGKLVDAMQNGTPCMMTSVAAEGMFGDLKPNGFIEDAPNDFVRKAVELYTNEPLWKEKQSFGFKAVNSRFKKTEFYIKLDTIIEETTQQLNTKRLNNFIGQMLWHHAFLSTKYMGKWIEEKHKKTTNYES